MSASKKIIKFLESNDVAFSVAEHPLAYTAAEVAGKQHVPGKQMIKSVIVKANGEYIMCVLPAIHLIDFEKLKKLIGNKEIMLAKEEELGALFPEYELGAEPPFGSMHGIKVFADKLLETDDEIVFNAGTHTNVIRMKYDAYKKLEKPTIGEIGTHI